jgi:hypothetical protein
MGGQTEDETPRYSHLENSRFFEPFWEQAAERIYGDKFYPRMTIRLGPTGGRLFESLFAESKEFIDPTKYRGMNAHSAQDLYKKVIEIVEAEQDRRDSRDGAMEEESLDDLRT